MLRVDAAYRTFAAIEMTSRQEEVLALRAGNPLPAHRIIQLRSTGMHAIRFEFTVRLLRSGLKIDTLTIYWERGNEFMLNREVENVYRKLAFGGRKRITGEFLDLWLLCYPDDDEIKQSVEREIDRMVERARKRDAE